MVETIFKRIKGQGTSRYRAKEYEKRMQIVCPRDGRHLVFIILSYPLYTDTVANIAFNQASIHSTASLRHRVIRTRSFNHSDRPF